MTAAEETLQVDEDADDTEECFIAIETADLSEEQASNLIDYLIDEDGHIDKAQLLAVLESYKRYREYFEEAGGGVNAPAMVLWFELDADNDGVVPFDEFRSGLQAKLGPLSPSDAVLMQTYDKVKVLCQGI